MPNIILTNKCNQKCDYCFAKSTMNLAKQLLPRELSLRNLKRVVNFLQRDKEKTVRLMGGEPTLHSQFKKIIDYILLHDFRVHLFTNGLFDSATTDFLYQKGAKIRYSFNINLPESYPLQSWKKLKENLEILSKNYNCIIGCVINKKDFNIDYLIELNRIYSLKNSAIMLRLAVPVYNKSNIYIPLSRYKILAKNLVREIKKASELKIRVGLGCGFYKNIFSNEDINLMKKLKVINLKWGCKSNSGLYDINTNLSVSRCFPLFYWQKKKLFDYDNSRDIDIYFKKIMRQFMRGSENAECVRLGPCFANFI